jgi:hypothetical protein
LADTTIDAATVQAYCETEYRAATDPTLVLRIGHRCEGLAALHAAHGVERSAFLTACNPLSRPLDEAENALRQEDLKSELRLLGVGFVDGLGQHPRNGWPGEASVLALGLSLDEARSLGMRHEQSAIVWCDQDAVPQLILLR